MRITVLPDCINRMLLRWLLKDPEFKKGSLFGKIWVDGLWGDLE